MPGVEETGAPTTPTPERAETDRSLRSERRKSDQALEKAGAPGRDETAAVAIVRKARDRADEVLETARDHADTQLQESRTEQQAVVKQERAIADRTLKRERDTADERLIQDRDRRELFYANLLREEREETDQRLLVERARADHAVTSRDEFLILVNHDLRNMLATIALSAASLVRGASRSEAGSNVSKLAEKIQRATVHMSRLVGDLVDIASIEAGKLAIAAVAQDACSLLPEAIEAFQHAASARGIALASAALETRLLARFDHDRVLQVLGNLVSNAIKFTGERGRILIRLERRNDFVCFSVKDTGVGIPEDHLQAVFERFWQVDKSDCRGLGMGLFISKCLVEAHGGRIWAESTVGAGSTFFFTLPAVSQVEAVHTV